MKLLTKIIVLFLLLFSIMVMADPIDPIPDVTGIIATDAITGDTYDFDKLLKTHHIVLQQTYSS